MSCSQLLARWSMVFCSILGSVTSLAVAADPEPAPQVIAIRVGRIYTGQGEVLERGVLLINGGRITAVGRDLVIPADANVLEFPTACLTAGLIDANARIESRDIVSRDRTGSGVSEAHAPTEVTGHAPHDPSHAHDSTSDAHCAPPNASVARASGHDEDSPCLPPACSVPHHWLTETEEEFVCHACGGADIDPPELASGVVETFASSEQTAEVIPHTRVIDTLNLDSPDFQRLLRGGVTTVYVSPDSSAVLGPRGAIVRTAGSARERIVRAEDAVKATIGRDPIWVGMPNRPARGAAVSTYTRRPTTRMGVVWVLRKAFHEAILRMQGRPLTGGADTPTEPALDSIIEILRGDVPLRIQARSLHDIATALRISEEFGFRFTLEEATDAYRCAELLKSRSVPIIFGPIYMQASGVRSMGGEVRENRLNSMSLLRAHGIQAALSAQELREEDGLARQAMYAMRFGYTFEDALRAVTLIPAQLLGLEHELGSVEVGKRGDVVVWSGEPFAATARPLLVLNGGRVVLDARDREPAAKVGKATQNGF
ncbi:MAG: amidohydrolase family protein [Planctomycetota bacterium]